MVVVNGPLEGSASCKMLILKLAVVCGLLALHKAHAEGWSYYGKSGPNQWKTNFPSCSKDEQSPINIYEGDARQDTSLISQPFQFHNYDKVEGVEMTMENNGNNAVVNLAGTTQVTVTGGGIPKGVFRAIQLNFHWGSDNKRGSEHFISTRVFPMELHIVHYNTKYQDLSVAATFGDGLAVLGFMFEIGQDNLNYESIVNNLARIKSSGSTVVIPTVSLKSFLPPIFQHFYRYHGSLTIPPCQQSVTWSVFKEVINISEQQLDSFRTLQDHLGRSLVDNFRPVQPLNSRAVTSNFDSHIEWNYGQFRVGADKWRHYFSKCAGENQSPVNIVEKEAYYDMSLQWFQLTNYFSYGLVTVLKNNGRMAQIIITSGDLSVSGGGLPSVYKAARIDFHWGPVDKVESEHQIDGLGYPLEMHIVHFRESLGSLEDAVTVPDGLAILAFFFEISITDNPALKPIIDGLRKIEQPGNSTYLQSFTLESILPAFKYKFFRYKGSITTPGCDESVIWTVFVDTIKISQSQLKAFRNLKSREKTARGSPDTIRENIRPVQNLNFRVVQRNYPLQNQRPSWSYRGEHGPRNWHKQYATCEVGPDSRQSPINLQSSQVEFRKIPRFHFLNYDTHVGVRMDFINNGRTAQMEITSGRISITGGGLDHEYRACHLQFHWGADNQRGSEHLINDKAYPMELHVVHYDTIYPRFADAASKHEGLAVFAFMFELTEEPNPAYDKIVSKLGEIRFPNTKTSVEQVSLASLLPLDMDVFYRYPGGLTAPQCTESVIWSVFKNTIKISQAQLNAFRSLVSLDIDPRTNTYLPMVDNFRPVMNLNKRVVFSNFGEKLRGAYSTNLSTRLSSCNIAGVSLLTLFVFFF